MTEWRVKVDGSVEPDLIDVEVIRNANPFGDHATAYIAELDGKRKAKYRPRTRVDFEAREAQSGDPYQTILRGFVVEARGRSEGGGDTLEVDCHSIDNLLRSGEMNGDLSGLNIKDALKATIENWVQGVAWNGNNVTVVENSQVERSFTNERVDNVIQALRAQSAGESFGVIQNNGQLEFEFGPAETTSVERGVGPGEWNHYDVPEKSADALNEVRVYYDDGDRVVVVDDSGSKRDLQDALGASEPVTEAESIMRKDITNRAQAIAAGEEVLADRSTTKEVMVSTFGLLNAEPRDTIPVNIPSAGVNDEFIIAQLHYTIPDEVELTLLPAEDLRQKSENSTTDMLVRASDSLKRVEMRPAAADSNIKQTVRAVETDVGVTLEVEGDVDGVQLNTFAVVNAGWRAIRDGLATQSPLTLSDVAVGTGDAPAARTQSALGNEVERVSASVSTSSGPAVTVDGSLTTGDTIREMGLFTSAGDLLIRGTLAEPVDAPDDMTLTLTVANDPEVDRAIATETGQALVRDTIAGTSPTWPDKFAVGSGSPAYGDESLTSLDSQEVARPLGNDIVRDEDTTDGLDAFVDVGSTDPVTITNGTVRHDQIAYVLDAQDDTLHDNQTSASKFTGGEAVSFDNRTSGDVIQFQFFADRPIPPAHAKLAVRGVANSGSQALHFDFNGIQDSVILSPSLDWYSTSLSTGVVPNEDQSRVNTLIMGDIRGKEAPADTDIDVVAVYDERHVSGDPSTWDNSVSGGYLSDPKLYADATDVTLGTGPGPVSLSRSVTDATVTLDITDTSNSQAIDIEGNVTTNTNSATASFTSTSDVSVTITLSRHGSGRPATPTTGYNGQDINSVQLETGATDTGSAAGTRSVTFESYVGPGTISTSTTLSEAGLLDTNGDLLSLSDIAFTVEPDLTLALRETLQLRRVALPVNESDFDVGLVSLSKSSASGADYRISITDVDTSV